MLHYKQLPGFQKGFTLLELLVSVAILLLVTGGAVVAFIGFNDRQNVRETARQVQQLVVLAQQKASVKEIPQSCITNNFPIRGYRVEIRSGTPQTAVLTALCSAITNTLPLAYSQPGSATYQDVETITFPTGVTASPVESSGYIDFYTLEGGINTSRTFTFTGSSASYAFSINNGGTITSVQ